MLWFHSFCRREKFMNAHDDNRREFLRKSILAVGATALPPSFAQAILPTYRRLEWQAFKTTSHYGALLFAINKMKSNGNSADPNSWNYWTNIHVNRCPHGISYFLAWHRGYLYYFERQLRAVSGDTGLVLPYWVYYANPNIPSEFLSPTSGNPLYIGGRVNTNISRALTMAPFSPSIANFPRFSSNPFEPNLENAPHNPVHDIIGGAMTSMQSPNDPIFWLHHGNIDRLWVAWVAAGGGRQMPATSNSYWSGSFIYNSALTMSRLLTYNNRSSLNYYYQAETMPTRLPGAVAGSSLLTGEAQPIEQQALLSPPPVGSYALSAPRATSATTFAAAGTQNIELDESSVSIQLPISAEHSQAMSTAAAGVAANVAGTTVTYRSVHLVLDNVVMSKSAREGGFFYNVYLNLPAVGGGGATIRSRLVGTLGPFRIAGAEHHHGGPAQVRYVITDMLAGLPRSQLGMMTVSFVRVSGDTAPAGTVIVIGEARIELSADDGRS
jgi:tyrosinase